MASVKQIIAELKALGDTDIAQHSQGFFKTGKGQYGEGDKFLGIRVPVLRRHAKPYTSLELNALEQLLTNSYHEVRLFALIVLVNQFKKADSKQQESIYQSYLAHTQYVNNWDLVDTSAHAIVGAWLYERPRKPLYVLVKSSSLWERRIAMISCYYFIKREELDDCLALAELLLDDEEDLLHKAVGWMLREAAKIDKSRVHAFLRKNAAVMPRTMLRYAIEKFPADERKTLMSL